MMMHRLGWTSKQLVVAARWCKGSSAKVALPHLRQWSSFEGGNGDGTPMGKKGWGNLFDQKKENKSNIFGDEPEQAQYQENLDADNWLGFDGDLDKVDEEGIPTWIAAVRKAHEGNEIAEQEEKMSARKERAGENVERVPMINEFGRAYATGRRKTSVARVWVSKSLTGGEIFVNKLHMADYFKNDSQKEEILAPFMVLDNLGEYDVACSVNGGGISGQAGAIRHGISRALQNFDPSLRSKLKTAGFLTRDPRMVERKKPGQPKARKKFQWVKR